MFCLFYQFYLIFFFCSYAGDYEGGAEYYDTPAYSGIFITVNLWF